MPLSGTDDPVEPPLVVLDGPPVARQTIDARGWRPYREPVGATLSRNGAIAVTLGAVAATLSSRGIRVWPATTLLALWPTFGGHFAELLFLNRVRPRLPARRGVQVAARIATWFIAGCLIAAGMLLTAKALGLASPRPLQIWWAGGIAFIAIELLAHLGLYLRGRDSVYNGLG